MLPGQIINRLIFTSEHQWLDCFALDLFTNPKLTRHICCWERKRSSQFPLFSLPHFLCSRFWLPVKVSPLPETNFRDQNFPINTYQSRGSFTGTHARTHAYSNSQIFAVIAFIHALTTLFTWSEEKVLPPKIPMFHENGFLLCYSNRWSHSIKEREKKKKNILKYRRENIAITNSWESIHCIVNTHNTQTLSEQLLTH